jgi:predicted dehydrogenase
MLKRGHRMEKIRWGIISTGTIAKQFARALAQIPDAELVAVGSRTQESADAFGAEFNVPHRYASYAGLAADAEVDVVYIGTPHPMHKDDSILCLEHGKAVLCEKPFTMNAAEAEAIINTARAKNLFLMEAMWTRFQPAATKLRELLVAGAIGEVRMMQADFGFRANFDPKSRLFDPALGGGSVLDVGIYPVSYASMVFGGQPTQIHATARLGQTGVDEEAAMLFSYPGGRSAQLACATRLQTAQAATIYGTEGRIQVPEFFKAERLIISRPNQPDETLSLPFNGSGYRYQAEEVHRCLRAGQTESPTMPLDETLALMRTLDAVLAQIHA